MNKLLELIQSREDISDYLFHFTKGADAFMTLLRILSEKKLKDIKKRNYICFSESPLPALYNMFQIFDQYDKRIYAPYGIGVQKKKLYEMGCRPVIYGTSGDQKRIPNDLLWRFQEYRPDVYDYSWLREWRLNQREYIFNNEDIIVILKQKSDEQYLMSDTGDLFDFDGDVDDGEFHGEVTGDFIRTYKTISLEEIRDFCFLSKSELNRLLSKQTLGEKETLFLGGF